MLTIARKMLLIICLAASYGSKEIAAEPPGPGLNETTLKGLEWRGIGPAMTAGRVVDIAIDPTDKSTWYVAAGSGGVFKTTNRGINWTPVFDAEGSYSIGCITIDPNDD